jgi:uncharacterized protein YbjT (DUF2867 family)
MRCLVTGATGYIGGRLVGKLLAADHTVRCMARDPNRLRDLPWVSQTEVVTADALDDSTLDAALEGIDVVYYLIHSIGGPGQGFAETDRRAATNLARAAKRAGVGRIVYLGGLHPADEQLSEHLRSRDEVANILLGSGIPTVVLQAAIIIGSGSASFEMLRYLTERLPAMITPRWVHTRIQPLAVRDVLRYLVGCATLPAEVNRRFDIGGPDVLTYAEMMRRYARVAGLRRRIIVSVPLLTPRLSALWVNLVTPVPNRLAKTLVRSLVNEVVCTEHDIAQYLPDPPEGLIGFDQAVELALAKIQDHDVETRWSGAAWPGAPSDPLPTDPSWAGGSLYTDDRTIAVNASQEALWRVIQGIGGTNGWYSFPLAWAARGWLDRMVGGVGLRRGRRDPQSLHVGEALDFWRVEEIQPPRLLRLRAEMKVPGLAWLELQAVAGENTSGNDAPGGPGQVRYRQRALFHPHGLAGHLYWWVIAPFHGIVFGGMSRRIAAAAAAAKPGIGTDTAVGIHTVGIHTEGIHTEGIHTEGIQTAEVPPPEFAPAEISSAEIHSGALSREAPVSASAPHPGSTA